MKITYFSYLADVKGISLGSANKAIGFMEGLRQLGHEVDMCWMAYQPEETKRKSFINKMNSPKRDVLRRFYHEPRLLLSNIKYIFKENYIIKQLDPDIVIYRLSLLQFSTLTLCKRKKIPFIVEADNPPIYEHNTSYGRNYFHLNRIAEYVEKQNLIHADAVFVISNVLRDYFLDKGVPKSKMYIVPNGADPLKFNIKPKDRNILKELQINDSLVVGWIGSGWQWLDDMIDMVQKVLAHRKDVKFLFIGGVHDKIRLQQLTREPEYNSHIILRGFVSYSLIPQYLSVMDIVIAPYPKLDLWYPSSMKVFEYMASGKAVVASAVGQIKEVIENGYNGYLFDSDIKGDLSNKVINLLDSPELCKVLGRNARKTIMQNYTWKHHAKAIENIINEVVKRKRASEKSKKSCNL